jgi:hypothetical protein
VSLNEVTLTLDSYLGTNVPVGVGTAFLTPSATSGIAYPGDSVYVWPTPIPVSLVPPDDADEDWLPTVTLISNDNSGGNPSSWEWTITFQAGQGAPPGFSFFLDYGEGAEQNLSGQTPTVASDTGYQYLPAPGGTPAVGDAPIYQGPGDIVWGVPGSGDFLPLAGGTLTGPLVVDAELSTAHNILDDGSGNASVSGTLEVGGTPLGSAAFAATSAFDASGAASQAQTNAETYASETFLPLTGGSLTGPLSISAGESAGGLLTVINTTASPTGPAALIQGAAAGDNALAVQVSGDTHNRLWIDTTGHLNWGTGSAAADTSLSRSSSGQLSTGAMILSSSNSGGQILQIKNSTSTPTTPNVQIIANAAGDSSLGIEASGDTYYRFTVDSNGQHAWGSGSAATDTTLSRGAAGLLALSGGLGLTTAQSGGVLRIVNSQGAPTSPSFWIDAHAAADLTMGVYVSGDTDMRWTIDSNGKMSWGPGGTTAADTTLYRASAGVLETGQNLTVAGNLYVATGATVTGGALIATGGSSTGDILKVINTTSAPASPTAQFIANAAADQVLGIEVSGDADYRFYIDSNGMHYWGSGSAVYDTDLYRSASQTLKTDGSLTVVSTLKAGASAFAANSAGTNLNYSEASGGIFTVTNAATPTSGANVELYAHAAADSTFSIAVSGDSYNRLLVDSNGKYTWGSGSAVGDTDLYRSGVSTLATDQSFIAAGYLQATRIIASGLTGATAASRYVGATTSGAPTSGTFNTGDFVIAQTGVIFICTTAGSPGSWSKLVTDNSSVGNIQPSPGTAAAGSVSAAADAGHVHGQPPMFAPTGLTGATAASRYVGATTAGPPASGTFSTGDWVIDQMGTVWVCTAAGTAPAGWQRLNANGICGTLIASGQTAPNGESVFPRTAALADNTMTSGVAVFSFFQAGISQPAADWVLTVTGGTAGSGLTVAQVGIYSVPLDAIYNINQNLTNTLLASVSDTTMWAAAYTPYSRQLAASCSLTAGEYYAVGLLAVGTDMPSIENGGNYGLVAPYLGTSLTGLSTLPSTFTLEEADDPVFLPQAVVSAVNIQ